MRAYYSLYVTPIVHKCTIPTNSIIMITMIMSLILDNNFSIFSKFVYELQWFDSNYFPPSYLLLERVDESCV